MGEFLEERMAVKVRNGALVSDDYSVEITTTASGAEYRRLRHAFPLRAWRIQYTLLRGDLGARVKSLYDRAFKSFGGFRIYCEDDCSTRPDGVSPPTALDEVLPRLSAGVYQLVKRYGGSGPTLAIGKPLRTLFKPVAGTVLIAVNAVPTAVGVSVDTTTGRVTISPAPSIGDTVTGGCYFDLPARFDSPLEVISVGGEVRDTGTVELVELLNP